MDCGAPGYRHHRRLWNLIMALDIKPRIRVPQTARKGDVVEIKTLVSHPMESGQRRTDQGQLIPRNIVNRLTVTFNGKPVFDAKLEGAISANPAINFFLRCTESGRLDFVWIDDEGGSHRASQMIAVS
jgi:sulfur-oxidizing protein SoxZ